MKKLLLLLCLIVSASLINLNAQDTAPQEKIEKEQVTTPAGDGFLPIPDLPDELDKKQKEDTDNPLKPENKEKAPDEQLIKDIENMGAMPQEETVDNIEDSNEPLPELDINLLDGPWIIKELAVQGNINIKPKVIIKTSNAKKKKSYFKEDINADIEKILGLGSIETVSIDISPLDDELLLSNEEKGLNYKHPVKLTFIVKEKLMITDILVEGNEKLSDNSVKRAMNLAKKDFFDELKIREDIIAIIDKYQGKGFIDATTDYEIKIDTEANTCKLSIIVKEGEKSKIAEVAIPNVKSFKLKKILKKMKNRPKKVYAPLELTDDLKKIEFFYKNRGFNNFKINSSSVIFNDNKSKVFINIDLDEGIKFAFGNTTFSGN
ncbi:MAG: hypothetical protein KAR84_05580, partial [Elusimicrobiales bacterium]|nr:hypothetical protein [Elusimicrobiales bacterium]